MNASHFLHDMRTNLALAEQSKPGTVCGLPYLTYDIFNTKTCLDAKTSQYLLSRESN